MLIGFEHVGVRVNDLDVSVAFYVDILGFTLVERTHGPNGSVAFLNAGGVMLEMFANATGAARATDVRDKDCGMRHIALCFDNVDAMFAKLEAAGAELIERPTETQNRTILRRKAFVKDPDGIMIELLERNPDFNRDIV